MNISSSNVLEKRAHKRVLISGIAYVSLEDDGMKRSLQTVASYVSLGGIGVYSYDPIKAKTDVSVALHFISSGGKLMTDSVEGHVIHSKKIEDTYFMGIQFLKEINAVDQPSLFEHIRKAIARGGDEAV